jgi:hypothetical protein
MVRITKSAALPISTWCVAVAEARASSAAESRRRFRFDIDMVGTKQAKQDMFSMFSAVGLCIYF